MTPVRVTLDDRPCSACGTTTPHSGTAYSSGESAVVVEFWVCDVCTTIDQVDPDLGR